MLHYLCCFRTTSKIEIFPFYSGTRLCQKSKCMCNKHTTLLKARCRSTIPTMYHLLVHSCCNLLIGDGHILRGWSEHTLHQRTLPLEVVVHWGGDSKVGKTAEVCACAVQQAVQTLAALRSCNQTVSELQLIAQSSYKEVMGCGEGGRGGEAETDWC